MTDQERQMIEALARRIQDAPAPQIDRDADDLIRCAIGARTDALYILTQTVLIQEMALTQAKAQIDELKQRVPAAGAGSPSFLGSTSNERAPQPAGWAQETGVQQPGGYRGSAYQKSSYQEPQTPPPQYVPPQPSGGGAFSDFLRNAATTAAGVVAGELAFSSLASIFGHRPGGFFGGGGGFFGGASPVSPVSESIINNNYYEDDRDRGGRGDRSYDGSRDDDRNTSGSDSDLQDVSDKSDADSDEYSSDDDSSYDGDSGSSDV